MSHKRNLVNAILSENRLSTSEAFDRAIREVIAEKVETIRPVIAESFFGEIIEDDMNLFDDDKPKKREKTWTHTHKKSGKEVVTTSSSHGPDWTSKPNVREDAEQVDELSKSTLGSYVKKASDSMMINGVRAGSRSVKKHEKASREIKNRRKGISTAVDKLGGASQPAKNPADKWTIGAFLDRKNKRNS